MDLTPEKMRVIWLILVVVLLIVEVATVGLTTIWFAAGAATAFVLTFFQVNAGWQIGMFLVVSIVLMVFTRPWAMKYVNRNREKTNYEGLIGRTARVTQKISNMDQTGKAVLEGQEWTARAEKDDQTIPENTLVIVQDIRGVKLIVREKEEK